MELTATLDLGAPHSRVTPAGGAGSKPLTALQVGGDYTAPSGSAVALDLATALDQD